QRRLRAGRRDRRDHLRPRLGARAPVHRRAPRRHARVDRTARGAEEVGRNVNPRTLGRLLGAYASFLVVLCLRIRPGLAVSAAASAGNEATVETWWADGQRVNRRAVTPDARPIGTPFQNVAVSEEVVTGEARLYAHPLFFTLGLVPGRDGVKAEIDGK